ncbi:MAG: hypothetical protein M3494_08780 [Actinomycetota bacterium]|jgi:hypothetical protein|nr:hypothetical protein [Rubrobacter sp.]MDQ3508094.1 hypothetical protein [Actinomycetota bacterium]
MRSFSLLFTFIALVVLAMLLIYVVRGPVDPFIAVVLFISFLACAIPALYLLKPFEGKDALERRRKERREKIKRRSERRESGESENEDSRRNP